MLGGWHDSGGPLVGSLWTYRGPEWSKWTHERMIPDHDALNGKMVVRKLWYNPSTAAYGCYLHPRVAVFLSTEWDIHKATPTAEVALAKWDLDVDTSQNVKDDFSRSDPVSVKGTLAFAPSVGYQVYIRPSIEVKVETSGLDFTPYYVYLAVQVTNMKIVARADRVPSP